MKLDSDLYAYIWKSTMENNSNSFVVGGEMPLVIDPGHQHLVKNLVNQMEKDGNRFEDIRLIISTHGHPDHFEATQTFARGGTMVALHPDEEKFLKEVGGQFYSAMGTEMPGIHQPVLAGKEGPVHRRCGFPHGGRTDGLPGRRRNASPGFH